jgi:hypothetical protein
MKQIFEYIISKSSKVLHKVYKNDKMYDFIKIFPNKNGENDLILDTLDKFLSFNLNDSFFIDLFISLNNKGCKFYYDDDCDCQKLIIKEYNNKERGIYYKEHYLEYLMYNKSNEILKLDFYDTYIRFEFIDCKNNSSGITYESNKFKLNPYESSGVLNYYSLNNQSNRSKFKNLIHYLYNR